jgi:hypothetical protein
MNWRDFLLIASRLAADTTEADWRTAVSRAYYAAFHVARRLLTDLKFAGRDLDTLRRLRNRADYDETPALVQPQADAPVQLSRGIIQSLDAARQEPARTWIRDAMIVYERDVLHDVTVQP